MRTHVNSRNMIRTRIIPAGRADRAGVGGKGVRVRIAIIATIVAGCVCAGLLGCRQADPLAQLEAQVRRNPDSLEGLVALGDAYMDAGMHHNAYIQYTRARTLAPSSADALMGLARANQALGNVTDGLEAASAAVELQPESAEALNLQADLLLQAGRPDDAAANYRDVLDAEPGNRDALIGLPTAYLAARTVAPAEEAARTAVRRLPDDMDALLMLAQSLVLQDESAEAETHLRRAIELAPDDARPPFRLAELLVRNGRDLEEAVDLAQRSGALDPADGVPASLAAVALQKLGRPQEGLEVLHEAALNYPRNIRLWLMMATMYRELGDEERAARAAAIALQFAPRRRPGPDAGSVAVPAGE